MTELCSTFLYICTLIHICIGLSTYKNGRLSLILSVLSYNANYTGYNFQGQIINLSLILLTLDTIRETTLNLNQFG